MLGAWGNMYVCVHENWHMCTCVAVSGCDAEREGDMVGTTRAYRCQAGMQVRNQIF